MVINAVSWASLPRVTFSVIVFFGLILTFLIPPIQGPDEDSHFLRTVMISEGKIFPTRENGQWGQEIPQSLRDYIVAHGYLASHPEKKYTYQQWYADSHARNDKEPRVRMSYSAQLTSPLLYLPQTAGILVGKMLYAVAPAFPFNWPAALYFGRLGNLLAFALGMALAVHFLPVLRHTVVFLAMMPMSVFLASTLSYDVTVTLTAVAFLTLIMVTWHSGSPPTRGVKAGILVAAFMLGHVKAVYLPLIVVIVLLRHVMPRRNFFLLSGGAAVAGVAGLAMAVILFGFAGGAGQSSVVSAQKAYLIGHLLDAPALIWHSLIKYSAFYIISFFGNFGWLDTNLPLPAIVLLLGLLLTAIIVDILQPRKTRLSWIDCATVLAGCLASVASIMLALYIIWTSHKPGGVGAPFVDGVQGRYFVPITSYFLSLFLIIPGTVGRRLTCIRGAFPQLQTTAAAAMLTLTCFAIIARFWLPNPP